jgi:hypothetical protein
MVRICLLAGLLTGCTALGTAQSCITVNPSSLKKDFGSYTVGTFSLVSEVVLKNNCTSTITITSISLSAPQFLLVYGWAPNVKGVSTTATYGLRFRPDSAGTFSGTFTVNVTGFSPIVVNLSGTGTVTTAAASYNTTSLAFGNQPIGTTSTAQSLTLTNTGTAAFTVESVYADAPFTVTGFSGQPTPLTPGSSLPLQVTFEPSLQGTYGATLVMTSDQLPPKGVTLSGTGAAATSIVVTNYPVLQSATQKFAYHAQLNAASATKPLSWSLATGSTLPTGLALSTQGVISGTVASSVAVGNYSFTVSVTDSSVPPHTATAQLTIPVGAPSGASCQNIDWVVAGTKTPITPINDLGTGTYLGTEGGLYLNGSNIMPASHDADGVTFAKAIQPLDGNGNPDPNGKYALLSIGMSTAFDTFLQLVQDATAEPTVNSHLVFVPGAMPNAEALAWGDPNYAVWNSVMDFFLPQQGVTANQVVAAWVSTTDSGITGTFPGDMTTLQSEFEGIAQNLHSKFPNLTLAFFTPRFYGGYANGLPHASSPEPYAYESGYAVRGMIQDQLNGLPQMNYNPANGPVMAPWVAWADYDWANGMLPRKDGFAWSCQDFQSNGIHNSNPQGREKDTNPLLNFLRSDDATAPWFLNPL